MYPWQHRERQDSQRLFDVRWRNFEEIEILHHSGQRQIKDGCHILCVQLSLEYGRRCTRKTSSVPRDGNTETIARSIYNSRCIALWQVDFKYSKVNYKHYSNGLPWPIYLKKLNRRNPGTWARGGATKLIFFIFQSQDSDATVLLKFRTFVPSFLFREMTGSFLCLYRLKRCWTCKDILMLAFPMGNNL